MLVEVAEGVLVHQSACLQSNAVIVEGARGVLLIDPGITADEMAVIAGDLRALNRPVVAGFSTHPHWDHALWHPDFGDAPRYGTALGAASFQELLATPGWESLVADGLPPEFAEDIPMELLGLITGVPAGTAGIPWDGPEVRIIEHRAHALGHAALSIEGRRVLVAGDMLSDVLIPMLDLRAADPIEDYLAALRVLDSVAGGVDVVIPGHGSVGVADEVRARIDQDRAYLRAVQKGEAPSDARIGPPAKEGWEWVSDVHNWQLQSLARRGEGAETS